MTRPEALNEQARLFPTKLYREYQTMDVPVPEKVFVQQHITLPDICLQLRSALNDSADPWETKDVVATKDMLQARIDTWQSNFWIASANKRCRADAKIDEAVLEMVKHTVEMANEWIKGEQAREENEKVFVVICQIGGHIKELKVVKTKEQATEAFEHFCTKYANFLWGQELSGAVKEACRKELFIKHGATKIQYVKTEGPKHAT